MLSVFFVQDWGSLMHAIKQAWWEWIHPFCLWVCFRSLRDMKECLIQASKQSMITSPPTTTIFVCCFCYNFLPRLKPGVFCSWKQEWYIIIICFFCPLLLKLGCFSSSFLPFWFVCCSLLAWFYSSTHQSLHDSSSTSSSAVLPFVSGLQQYFMGCVKVLSFDLVLGRWGKSVGIILFSLM